MLVRDWLEQFGGPYPTTFDEEFFARIEDGAPVIVFETPQEKFIFKRVLPGKP